MPTGGTWVHKLAKLGGDEDGTNSDTCPRSQGIAPIIKTQLIPALTPRHVRLTVRLQ